MLATKAHKAYISSQPAMPEGRIISKVKELWRVLLK